MATFGTATLDTCTAPQHATRETASQVLHRLTVGQPDDKVSFGQMLDALGERGFALLTGRWRALQRITASPSRIGDITAATRMLTEYEQRDLHRSC